MAVVVPAQIDACLKDNQDGTGGPCWQYFSCVIQIGNANKTFGCPPPQKQYGFYSEFTFYYVLNNETGLFNTLNDQYGIDKDWIKFGGHDNVVRCTGRNCYPQSFHWRGEPQAKDDFAVPNPKNIISKAGGGMDTVEINLAATLMDMVLASWGGSGEDVVQSMSLPVFIILQSVESMKDVKKVGQDAKDDEKKKLILDIVTAVLLLIPFAGELGAAVFGVEQIARIAAMVGQAGSAALTMVDIVNDPEMAPAAIMGMLLGTIPGFGRTPKGFRELSSARRLADPKKLEKFGAIFNKWDTSLQKIIPVKACAR